MKRRNDKAIALFDEIAYDIERRPDTYNQSTWGGDIYQAIDLDGGPEDAAEGTVCGTKACIAGKAAILTGKVAYRVHFEYGDPSLVAFDPATGVEHGNFDYANETREALDLDTEESVVLFSERWGRDLPLSDVPRALREIARGDRDVADDHPHYRAIHHPAEPERVIPGKPAWVERVVVD